MDQDGTKLSYNLRFPGQYYDAETGKHYNFNRDYDPVIGRYVQSDPIGLDGGENTYIYVSDSPLINKDPDGNGKIGGAIKLTKKAWNHIFNRHVKRGIYVSKGKFKDPKFIKKYINKAIKNPDRVTKQADGRTLIEKRIGGRIGHKGEEYLRVVIEKNGDIVTAFPASSLKTLVPGANIGTSLFGAGFLSQVVDFVNPLSDIQDVINFF